MATNKLTDVRHAIEALFTTRLADVVSEVLRFDSEHAQPFGGPDLEIKKWLRIDPMGGPIDPHASAGSWLITRQFRVVFNLETRNMDAGQLETVEKAILGCIATGESNNLGLAYVRQVRPTRWETGIFEKTDPATKKKREMWIGLGMIEVDIRITKTEMIEWVPTE